MKLFDKHTKFGHVILQNHLSPKSFITEEYTMLFKSS